MAYQYFNKKPSNIPQSFVIKLSIYSNSVGSLGYFIDIVQNLLGGCHIIWKIFSG
jgi:hypothetical protein